MADLLETKQDGVAILTMNRPEARNALSQPMLAALLEALPRLAADASIGAIVITGAGGAFCAGGDVKGFAATDGGANHGRSPEEAAFAIRYFGVTDEGNFEDHSHPDPLKNQNVLSVVNWRAPLAAGGAALLAGVKTKLLPEAKADTAFKAEVTFSGTTPAAAGRRRSAS